MLDDVSYTEVDGVVEKIVENADKASMAIDPKHFMEMPSSRGGRVAAVDGGSAVLHDLGSLLVGVYRSGFLVYEDGERVHEEVSKLRMVSLDKASASAAYEEACLEAGFSVHTGPRELDAVLERLRYISEMRHALCALESLGEGDLLLLDGSLRADITHPGSVVSTIVEQAMEKNVSVAGISKSSSLHIGGLPVLSLARHRAREMGLESWLYPVGGEDSHEFGDVYAACFHPGSRFAFRVDVAGSLESLGCLLGYCTDASLLGYPSPLASVHNMVAVPRSSAFSLGLLLESRLATLPSARSWPDLLTDFHSILDMGV